MTKPKIKVPPSSTVDPIMEVNKTLEGQIKSARAYVAFMQSMADNANKKANMAHRNLEILLTFQEERKKANLI